MTPIVWLTRLLVGAYPQWEGTEPAKRQRIYFANHTSHLDTIVIWTSLPSVLRRLTRPVAAKDYWDHGLFRKRIAMKELNVVLIDRRRTEHADPLAPLKEALRAGDSLIIFPEGTRRPQPLPSEFKSGLWRLMREFPEVELSGVLLGFVSICYLGKPYEVHTLDMSGQIIEHYQSGQMLPNGMEKARSIALRGGYDFIEVYIDCCRAVSSSGAVSVIPC